MRHTVGYFAVAALALAPSLALAQTAKPTQRAIVIEQKRTVSFANAGDFGVGIGRPTTFDDLPLDVRENIRPRQSYGPVSNVACSPSIPDC